MKLIHLSDLHLGKRVNEFSMIDDQRYILQQIISVAEREQADGVIIAGDIYDKPVPPAEAVQLFDGFLTELAKRDMLVFVISGNHDSVERLAFGAQLMSGRGVYFSPVFDGEVKKIRLTDSCGELFVYLLPYLKPAAVRHAYGEEEICSCQDAVAAVIGRMELDVSARNILVAHQFVTGAGRCESEDVQVGGLDQVDASVFDAFDYVALGHIHSPQSMGKTKVRYCGTPLKYSFSEADQEKSVTVAELQEKGKTFIRTVPLIPLHDMRKIRGSYLEVTARSFYQDTDTEDYLQITLTDEEDVVDGMAKLRVIYPNVMRLEYDNRRTGENRDICGTETAVQKNGLELFQEFYELQNNQPMSGPQALLVEQLIRRLQEKEEQITE